MTQGTTALWLAATCIAAETVKDTGTKLLDQGLVRTEPTMDDQRPTTLMASAPGSGGSNGGERGWPFDRGEVFFRLRQQEDRSVKLEEAHADHVTEFAELRTEVLQKLTKIEGKLDFLGVRAGIWAAVLNAFAIVSGLLLLYWKIQP